MNEVRDLLEEIARRARAARAALSSEVLAMEPELVQGAFDSAKADVEAIEREIDRAVMFGVVPR